MMYSSLLLAVLVVGAPYWLLRMATSGRYRAGLLGRLGLVPEGLRTAIAAKGAGRDVIWVHAVSVGEVLAATQLIRELKAALPGWVVAVSTTTETGQKLATERLTDRRYFNLPLDFRFTVRRYLRVLRAEDAGADGERAVAAADRGVLEGRGSCGVVNARISDRSFPALHVVAGRLWRPFLEMISLFLAQSRETAERLVKIGAPAERVRVMGNLKYDVRAGSESALTEILRERLPVGAEVVVCGSTLEGEEQVLLEAWRAVLAAEPNAVMVLAPRHPDRFASVAAMVAGSGFAWVRASEFRMQPDTVTAEVFFCSTRLGTWHRSTGWRLWRLWEEAWWRRVGTIRWSRRSSRCRW